VLFYVLFVLWRSLYCLCVYVYWTTATGWLPNCSKIYIISRQGAEECALRTKLIVSVTCQPDLWCRHFTPQSVRTDTLLLQVRLAFASNTDTANIRKAIYHCADLYVCAQTTCHWIFSAAWSMSTQSSWSVTQEHINVFIYRCSGLYGGSCLCQRVVGFDTDVTAQDAAFIFGKEKVVSTYLPKWTEDSNWM
jgi:hypothetical protein